MKKYETEHWWTLFPLSAEIKRGPAKNKTKSNSEGKLTVTGLYKIKGCCAPTALKSIKHSRRTVFRGKCEKMRLQRNTICVRFYFFDLSHYDRTERAKVLYYLVFNKKISFGNNEIGDTDLGKRHQFRRTNKV